MYSNIKQLFVIVITFHNFYCIFDQINAAFVSKRDFFVAMLRIEHVLAMRYEIQNRN